MLIEDADKAGVVPNLKRHNLLGQGRIATYASIEAELADYVRRNRIPSYFVDDPEYCHNEEILYRRVAGKKNDDFLWDAHSITACFSLRLKQLRQEQQLNSQDVDKVYFAEFHPYVWLHRFMRTYSLSYKSISNWQKFNGLSLSEIEDRITTTLFKFLRLCRERRKRQLGQGKVILLFMDETSLCLEPGAMGRAVVSGAGSVPAIDLECRSSRRLCTFMASITSDSEFSVPQCLLLGDTCTTYEKRIATVHYGISNYIEDAALRYKKRTTIEVGTHGIGIGLYGNKKGKNHCDAETFRHWLNLVRKYWCDYRAVAGNEMDELIILCDGARCHKVDDVTDRIIDSEQARMFVIQPQMTSWLCSLDVFCFSAYKARMRSLCFRTHSISILQNDFRSDLAGFNKQYGGPSPFLKLGYNPFGHKVEYQDLHSRLKLGVAQQQYDERMSLLPCELLSKRALKKLNPIQRNAYIERFRWLAVGVAPRNNRERVALTEYSLMEAESRKKFVADAIAGANSLAADATTELATGISIKNDRSDTLGIAPSGDTLVVDSNTLSNSNSSGALGIVSSGDTTLVADSTLNNSSPLGGEVGETLCFSDNSGDEEDEIVRLMLEPSCYIIPDEKQETD